MTMIGRRVALRLHVQLAEETGELSWAHPGELGTITGTFSRGRYSVAFDRDAGGPGQPLKERVVYGKYLTDDLANAACDHKER